MPVGVARRGLHVAREEIRPAGDDLVVLEGAPPRRGAPRPRLLGSFDELLLGWVDRTAVLGGVEGVVRGGLFAPFVLLHGRAAGLWSLVGGRVRLDLRVVTEARDRAALERDAADVVRFLGPGAGEAQRPRAAASAATASAARTRSA